MNMGEIRERIEFLLEHYGLNKKAFSERIGVQPQTLHHILGGRQTNPSYEVINKILKTFSDLNARWFVTGEGEMFSDSDTNKNNLEIDDVSEIKIKSGSDCEKELSEAKIEIKVLQRFIDSILDKINISVKE